MKPPFPPTAPGIAQTAEPDSQIPYFGFVLLWSRREPHRVGEIAFCPPLQVVFVGRGGEKIELFATFERQVPGVEIESRGLDGCLHGESISGYQLQLRATAVDVELEVPGRCVTWLNGKELKPLHKGVSACANVKEGDLLLLQGEVLLLCVRRSKTMPALKHAKVAHVFGQPDAHEIIGESPHAWKLRDDIANVAARATHVLINGESGTGKDLTANAIHALSKRATGPFIAVNAAVSTGSLRENELYGNVANYPQAGMPARVGLFPAADKGTLFLDEVGELTHKEQAELLRALQQGQFKVQGETRIRHASVRMVAATNRPDSVFRADFRHRFSELISLVALRFRREDIPLLLTGLLYKHVEEDESLARFFDVTPSGERYLRISGRLVAHLAALPLVDGNVRELGDILLAAATASTGDIVQMFPVEGEPSSESQVSPPKGAAAPVVVVAAPVALEKKDPSKEELVALLEQEGGSVQRVARRLGLDRAKVYRLQRLHGLNKEGSKRERPGSCGGRDELHPSRTPVDIRAPLTAPPPPKAPRSLAALPRRTPSGAA